MKKLGVGAWMLVALGLLGVLSLSAVGLAAAYDVAPISTVGDLMVSESNQKHYAFALSLSAILAAYVGTLIFTINKIKSNVNYALLGMAAFGLLLGGLAWLGPMDQPSKELLILKSMDPAAEYLDDTGELQSQIDQTWDTRESATLSFTERNEPETRARLKGSGYTESEIDRDPIEYKSRPVQIDDEVWLQQRGLSLCVLKVAEVLKDSEVDKCVLMNADLTDYTGAEENTLVAAPLFLIVFGSAGLFFPLALLISFAGFPAAIRAKAETAEEKQRVLRERWDSVSDKLDEVVVAWGDLASDPLSVLDHSALLDNTEYRTQQFILALAHATDFRSVAKKDLTEDSLSDFEDYVSEAARTWEEAVRYAKQVGWNWLSEEDQKVARRARTALAMALDENQSVEARINYAETGHKLLEQLAFINLPAPLMLKLDFLKRKELMPSKS